MLNIAFCDDDREFLDKALVDTRKILIDLRSDCRIYTYTDGNRIIADFIKYQPYFDIVFLDINMPVINGKEVAKRLRILDKRFKLIFITVHEEEALDILQYNVSGFISKKDIDQHLPVIIRRVINTINEENPRECIFKTETDYEKKMLIKVPLNDLIFIESINRKIHLYTKRGTFVLHGHKFADLIEQYLPLGFVHIHRTCIVNARYISSLNDFEVCLENGIHLPISRRKKQVIMDSFLASVNL